MNKYTAGKTYHKSIDLKAEEIDKDKMQVIFNITNTSVDADNEVVLPKGGNLERYQKNPVVLFGHQTMMPVAKTLWIKSTPSKILAKAQFTDKTPLSRDTYNLIQEGILNAASIGFTFIEGSAPTEKELEKNPQWKNVFVIRKWELHEWSVISVPSNPEALVQAKSMNLDEETLHIMEIAEQEIAEQEIAEEKEINIKEIVRKAMKQVNTFDNVESIVDRILGEYCKSK